MKQIIRHSCLALIAVLCFACAAHADEGARPLPNFNAVQKDEVKPDKTVEVRSVKVGLTQGDSSVITSGLAPGDQVVTDGQDKLQAGSHVEPHAAGTSPAGKNAQASGIAGQ